MKPNTLSSTELKITNAGFQKYQFDNLIFVA